VPTQQQPAKKSTTAKVASVAAKATPESAVVSTAAKAAGKARPAAKKPASKGPRLSGVGAHGRKWLLAELVVCVLLLTLAGMTGQASKDGTQTDTGSQMAVKGSALAGVFIVLGLVSAGGRGAEKTAGALGLMITLAYMFNEREVFTTLSAWAKAAGAP
jgi:hypothetical protein